MAARFLRYARHEPCRCISQARALRDCQLEMAVHAHSQLGLPWWRDRLRKEGGGSVTDLAACWLAL